LPEFRAARPRIDGRALVLHGDADRILPIAATGFPLPEALKGSRPG
jgi:non-heme chloroperoxidase